MGKGSEDLRKKEGLPSTSLKSDTFPAWAKDLYGLNELDQPEGTSIFKLILEQFNDTLVHILLAAAIFSFVLAFVDGEEGGEMGITATNAEKALEALKEIQSQHATVIRDGNKVSSLPAKELVPGDIVELRVGDKVPADMRVVVLISSTLRVKQGLLTGERTTAVNGNCICLVTNTRMSTEIGRVHSQIQEAAQHEEDTPMKKKLNEFGEPLTMIIGLICALVWLINVKYFLSWEYVDGWPSNFKFSFEKCTYYFEIVVALAVATIPEGLPAVITTCLALGTRKMARKNVLVRKLPSLETLGCKTVICSDKNGTLTTNQMAVSKLVAMGSRIGTLRSFNVKGTSVDP
ncbi:hypothetical protein Bca101_044416 [Brassica carinata]